LREKKAPIFSGLSFFKCHCGESTWADGAAILFLILNPPQVDEESGTTGSLFM
jgi:hypothetical protein